ncbi:MAG: peptide chain release factor 3 [Cyanobacteriota bacterium erpe_2018_sw_39hr_WHONDRS-SW48-000098_B_bin.30]|jgi:peptide chain release factor 3|nr:peptide chain release factor 3 [Cyanobacteriota bacterium erpe_2018_sw_39hr_WHONDRS-SW48-000098_B_bin.30]
MDFMDSGTGTVSETELSRETARRRTFAIISHPDAGKTTLTEKLLLFGGAIAEAGAVKSRGAQRHAKSDWMELEKQRGISITSTVLQFEFSNCCLNLLDTPGHQDFSEDTYRTLAAADNAVMLIDAAKGLEPQTRKLFEVCRMRKLPLFTFINKLDRPGLEPLELIDEIEREFKLAIYPVNWPIGTGNQFRGVVDRRTSVVHLFERSVGGRTVADVNSYKLDDPYIKELIPAQLYEQMQEELQILDAAAHPLDIDKIHSGDLTPVYFGSAMNNFGVELFLRSFIEFSLTPGSFPSTEGEVKPTDTDFTGFVFKLQANMDPRHRDRIAFVRICSGCFEKDMTVVNSRTSRPIQLSQPKKLFAQERESIEKAYPGDIVGFSNPGAFAIGDTISSGKLVSFPGIPTFAPELFAFLENKEPSKYKQFHKGIKALQDEGAIQIFWLTEHDTRFPLLAAVGALQFEVVQFRLLSEYGAASTLRNMDVHKALWVVGGFEALKVIGAGKPSCTIASDKFDEPVLLFKNKWDLAKFEENYPSIQLTHIDPSTGIQSKTFKA